VIRIRVLRLRLQDGLVEALGLLQSAGLVVGYRLL
jgi:hypothetical protein